MIAGILGQRADPAPGFNFLISLIDSPEDEEPLAAGLSTLSSALGGKPLAGFSECSGLDMTLQLEDYNEGGRNSAPLRFPTRTTWGNITLRRGVSLSTDLWDWALAFATGNGVRKDGMITLQDAARRPHTVWTFRRGLPARWIGPTLNAARSEVAIEAIEIAHEGLIQSSSFAQGFAAGEAIADLFG